MAKAAGKLEHEAAMDYAEHVRTYENFLWLTKWVVVFCAALLVAMAAGFFGGMGLAGGTLVFIVLMVAAYFLL